MAATDNIHIAGVKAVFVTDVEDTPMKVNEFYPSLKVKNPAGDTITVNPVAYFQREVQETRVTRHLKDPKVVV